MSIGARDAIGRIRFGLSVVEKIADAHGGSISFNRRAGGDTIARLNIPATKKGYVK